MTLLNQHKRTHNQEESHSDTVTVVTNQQQPNIIQAQNIISDGQNLGQIQIVSADSLENAQLQHSINDQISIVQQHSHKADKNKCITCGSQLPNASKRKGSKAVRCESCLQNEGEMQNSRPTQIFVSQDGDIKFEVNNSNVIKITPSLKKKQQTVTTVTKCNTCNGTGVVVVNDNNSAASSSNAASSTKLNTSRSSSSPQKNQSIQVQTIHQQQAPSPPPLLTHQIHHPVQHHAPPANQSAQSLNDKPFSCNICGGKFSRYSSLWSHKKLHSGEKNYKCEICNSVFAKAVYLKNHMRIHSG